MSNPDERLRLTSERRAEIERQQRTVPSPWMPSDAWVVAFFRATRHDVPDLLAELAAVEAERDELRLLYQASQEALTEAVGELSEWHEMADVAGEE